MPKIAVIDTETCGLEATDPVCELGLTELVNEGAGWAVGKTTSQLFRVETMPPQARAIHHIRAEDTHGEFAFAPELMWSALKGDSFDVVAAHNWSFDALRFGEPQLPALCTLKAARHLFPEAPGHGNAVLSCWLEDQGLISPEEGRRHPAHRAGPDTYVTALILQHMLTLTTAAQMVAWTKQPLVFHVWGFGKHRGEKLTETPADYLDFMVTKAKDVDEDVRWNCRRELDRRAA